VYYSIVFKKSAEKELRGLQHDIGDRIIIKINQLEQNPYPAGCKKLKGFLNTYRIRIGDYRVLYDVRDEELIIMVIKIANRKNAY
jgi:mRNA interferase RelE/StbE